MVLQLAAELAPKSPKRKPTPETEMKEPLKKTAGNKGAATRGWYQHLADCIAAEQCPYCGEEIFVNEESTDHPCDKRFFFECSACPWRNS